MPPPSLHLTQKNASAGAIYDPMIMSIELLYGRIFGKRFVLLCFWTVCVFLDSLNLRGRFAYVRVRCENRIGEGVGGSN